MDYPAVEGGCDHAVLIVGYNADHWLVSCYLLILIKYIIMCSIVLEENNK